MKTFTTVLMLLFLWVLPAYALSPVNEDTIKDAQNYGRSKVKLELNEFLAPWTSYEEKAVKISDATDRVLFYTPYILIAHDARDKAKANQPIKLADTERILADYAGYYIFTAIFRGDTPVFTEKITAVVKQDKKIIMASDISLAASEVVPAATGSRPTYQTRAYIYFYDKDIKPGQPITLALTTEDKQIRSFYFDLSKIK